MLGKFSFEAVFFGTSRGAGAPTEGLVAFTALKLRVPVSVQKEEDLEMGSESFVSVEEGMHTHTALSCTFRFFRFCDLKRRDVG